MPMLGAQKRRTGVIATRPSTFKTFIRKEIVFLGESKVMTHFYAVVNGWFISKINQAKDLTNFAVFFFVPRLHIFYIEPPSVVE